MCSLDAAEMDDHLAKHFNLPVATLSTLLKDRKGLQALLSMCTVAAHRISVVRLYLEQRGDPASELCKLEDCGAISRSEAMHLGGLGENEEDVVATSLPGRQILAAGRVTTLSELSGGEDNSLPWVCLAAPDGTSEGLSIASSSDPPNGDGDNSVGGSSCGASHVTPPASDDDDLEAARPTRSGWLRAAPARDAAAAAATPATAAKAAKAATATRDAFPRSEAMELARDTSTPETGTPRPSGVEGGASRLLRGEGCLTGWRAVRAAIEPFPPKMEAEFLAQFEQLQRRMSTVVHASAMLVFFGGLPGWSSSKVYIAATEQQQEMPNRPAYLGAVLGLTLFGGLACFVGLLVPLIASSGVRKISYQQLERLLLVLGVIVISLMPFNNIWRMAKLISADVSPDQFMVTNGGRQTVAEDRQAQLIVVAWITCANFSFARAKSCVGLGVVGVCSSVTCAVLHNSYVTNVVSCAIVVAFIVFAVTLGHMQLESALRTAFLREHELQRTQAQLRGALRELQAARAAENKAGRAMLEKERQQRKRMVHRLVSLEKRVGEVNHGGPALHSRRRRVIELENGSSGAIGLEAIDAEF